MGSLKKNIERISKNINSEIYEIYIYEEKLEISDKSHYIKIDKNVGLLHIFKLLNILHLKDKINIMFLSNDGDYGYDKIGSNFLEIMTPDILKKLYANLYTTQNIIIFTV